MKLAMKPAIKCPNCDSKLPDSFLDKPMDHIHDCPSCSAQVRFDEADGLRLVIKWMLLSVMLHAVPMRFGIHLIMEQSRWVEGVAVGVLPLLLFMALLYYSYVKPRLRFEVVGARPGYTYASKLSLGCILALAFVSLLLNNSHRYLGLPAEYPDWVQWSIAYIGSVIVTGTLAYLFYRFLVRFKGL